MFALDFEMLYEGGRALCEKHYDIVQLVLVYNTFNISTRVISMPLPNCTTTIQEKYKELNFLFSNIRGKEVNME